jgi:DNA-nicking Smr family endonuclease
MKKQIQQSDLELFRQHVQDAEPILHDHVEPNRRRPPPIPRPRPIEWREAGMRHLSESEIETHDFLLFSRPGVQRRLVAELQRGGMEIGLELDLHGLHADHARELLGQFLAECGRRRIRCALIIHGKGHRSSGRQPILKQKVNYWLRLHEEVLAFCSAARSIRGTASLKAWTAASLSPASMALTTFFMKVRKVLRCEAFCWRRLSA